MPAAHSLPTFELQAGAREDERTLELRLCDAAGHSLATNVTRLAAHPSSRFEGLFDLRRFVERYADLLHPLGSAQPLTDHELVAELSVFLGRTLLGPAILDALGRHSRPRVLRVRVPETAGDLAAALARVPWEFARRDERDSILADKNVLVQLWPDEAPAPPAAPLDRGEPLRVLLVFAATRGGAPLAARLEHRSLLDLFHRRIYPQGRVRVDALIHGVTRRRLEQQIERAGGYHVVHWSGHGHVGRLALDEDPDGSGEPSLSGGELAEAFTNAGQALPHLVFLGACRSGDGAAGDDPDVFEATLAATRPRRERRRRQGAAETLESQLRRRPGYTGVARALIAAGAGSVVAMRYEVGDEYARALALEFYARLLGQARATAVREALNQARRAVQRRARDADAFDACDHAAPVLYGQGDPELAPCGAPTPVPSLHPLPNVDTLRPHAHFVGRSTELARLAAGWLDDARRPVALISGLGGLGKTALAAEAIDLWHERFRYVFSFDCRGGLAADDFLRDLHTAWLALPSDYAERVTRFPTEALWRPASERFAGAERESAVLRGLREALRLEAVLIVLDNFESNLALREPEGAEWECQEPAWQRLLGALSEALHGRDSRLLITARQAPRGYAAGARVLDVPLGTLPLDEAALYVMSHDTLREAWFERGQAGRAHVQRLLDVSRGHPLLLDRLARLAPFDLELAIERIGGHGLAALPGFLASDPAQAAERAYLEGALASSIDLLLERAGAQARHALWVLSLAREAQTAPVWRAVTQRELPPGIDLSWANAPALDPGQRRTRTPSTSRKDARANRNRQRVRPGAPSIWTEQVERLVDLGLVQEMAGAEARGLSVYDCHELVRERVGRWVESPPSQRAEQTSEGVWALFGAHFADSFRRLRDAGRLSMAIDAGRRALSYLACSRSLGSLVCFAGEFLAETRDPSVLVRAVQELERAVAGAEHPPLERDIRTLTADALIGVGRPEASLAVYEAAAASALRASAWGHLAWINANWAVALADCGQLEKAYAKHLEAADFKQRGGAPAVDVLGSQLEAWRVGVMLRETGDSAAQIATATAVIRDWWQRSMRGETLAEAPDIELLGRVYLSALDAMREVHVDQGQWQDAMDRVTEAIQVERTRGASEYEIARDRFNSYLPLLRLRLPDQALKELKHCLAVFEGANDRVARGRTLSALADVYHEKGDLAQAVSLQRRALALVSALPDPESRGVSHHNLGLYLGLVGDHAGMAAHELAAVLYMVASGHVQHVQHWADVHARRILQARHAGWIHELPKVRDLLGQPSFAALAEWLAAQQVDSTQAQEVVDAITAKCLAAADGITN